jgi:hypothetical protein
MNITLHKNCDIYLILGACGNQIYAAARAYAESYLARRHPDSNVFCQLDERGDWQHPTNTNTTIG